LRVSPMPTATYYLTFASVIAVGVVLTWGLWTMLKGTTPNLSQKLMRWRVGLQFIAIVIIMLAVYFKRSVG
jgi:Hypoxia induced protein conserved region